MGHVMANAPLFDVYGTGTTTSSLNTTTNISYIILSGTVEPGAVDIEVNVNGAGWSTDPSLVGLTATGFTIPNLTAHPSGYFLENGLNSISVRSINVAGSRSDEATANITKVLDTEYGLSLIAPTAISYDRNANSITLKWSDTSNGTATGFNIYASTGPSGTGSGYLRVNASIIPSSTPSKTTTVEDEVESYSVDGSNSVGSTLRVRSEIINPATNELIEKKTENYFDLTLKPSYKYTASVSRRNTVKEFYFKHNRTDSNINGVLNGDVFSFVPSNLPIYYVVTALYYDAGSATLRESRYSVEIAANPLPIDNTVRGVNIREPAVVIEDYILKVQQVAPELSLIPGSTIREVHIEPFANEIQKAYFLMDFIHRANSFVALLNIDDPTLSGTSVPVASSTYKSNLKTALSSNSDSAVQALIDSAFDNLGANIGIPRPEATYSTVNQLFYVNSRPTRDVIVSQGSIVRSSSDVLAPRFIARSQATIYAATADTFYNPITRRYEIYVPMVAEVPGAVGNVSAGTLDTVDTGAINLQTINLENGVGGRDRASNLELAELGIRAYSSVDTGTKNGYLSQTLQVPGVLDATVIPSGHPYMWRDYSLDKKEHLGGKVDIYVKGVIERTVNETFAFSYTLGRNVVFKVLDVNNLVFRALDSRLSPDNSIEEMLNDQGAGLGLKNMSRYPVEFYNLSGIAYLDYRTIRLNNAVPQPYTNFDDMVEGDFRFSINEQFTMSVQPVSRVLSINGQISGALDPQFGYTFYKLQDPVLLGYSTKASDSVEINSYNGVPTGEMIQVNAEEHTVVGHIAEPLNSLGINTLSLKVFSQERSILYNGPDNPNPDYEIILGTKTTPISIVRTQNTTIPSGSVLSVDYEHEENFVISYVTNSLLQDVNSRVEKTRHITADVVVKQALENPLSINATVILTRGANQSVVDLRIRAAISSLLMSKGVGGTVHISDVVSTIQNIEGVSYLVQPFERMTLRSGGIRIRDNISNDFTFIPSLSSGFNKVFISDDSLPFNSVDGGGPPNVFHAVNLDGVAVTNARSIGTVGTSSPQSYIIGYLGASISGYSDDATLAASYPAGTDLNMVRLEKTANRVLISLPIDVNPSNDPSLYEITATYVTAIDNSSQDVTAGAIEYLSPGDLVINYKVM